MKRIVRAAAVLVAAMLAVLTPGPAMATGLEFSPAPCFSGAIDTTTPTDDYLELTGYLNCGGLGSDATFGVAHYYAEAGGSSAMFDSTLRRYGNTAPSKFTVGNEADSNNFGLCVVTDYDVRVACVRVWREKNAMVYAVTPLPTDDPLVNRRVSHVAKDVPGRTGVPVCGGCW